MEPIYLVIPLISGLIGWGTNYLAVKMIFRPYRKFKFLGITIQGLIPRRRNDLAEKISETVSEHLISHEDFAENLKKANIDEGFRILIDEKLERFIKERLFSFSPVIAGFLSDSVKDTIKSLIIDEVVDILPEIAEKMADKVQESFDTKKIVAEKINGFDLEKLENIIMSIAKKELQTIEVLGGILGALIGCVQLWILLLLEAG